MSADLLVIGSGGAGLVAALKAAAQGAAVLVLEASPQLGGTTAISGGNVWIPANRVMAERGFPDTAADALAYLLAVTRNAVDEAKLRRLLQSGPDMIDFIEARSPLRFICIERPDYHPTLPGAADNRGLEVAPLKPMLPDRLAGCLRASPTRGPVTYGESRAGIAAGVVQRRRAEGYLTQGAGLVAGLVEACDRAGVRFRTHARAASLLQEAGRVVGCRLFSGEELHASQGVILASGGFEWNDALQKAFLPGPRSAPITPPHAYGDGLLMGLSAGAAIDNMTEAWWTAAVSLPGETYDGHPMTRNIVRDLALPGSILVNAQGRRFVNEASGYNELGKAFLHFDPQAGDYINARAWLIFDQAFLSRYGAETARPVFVIGETIEALARSVGIAPGGLAKTLAQFNRAAQAGKDCAFGRGSNAHDRFVGDSEHHPNPCLGEISAPPFHAVPIRLGKNGTKGGLVTDPDGRVLTPAGRTIAGLFACGDVAASPMGPGYPGSGGSLGPAMALSYQAAISATASL